MKTFLLLLIAAVQAFAIDGVLTKAPSEKVNISVDFVNRASGTITISSIKAINTRNGSDVTNSIILASPAPSVSSQAVTFRVKGGNIGDSYNILVIINKVSTGEVLQGTIALNINQ